MLYGLLKTAHVLAIIIWIGGMLFSLYFLSPAAARLDLPTRASLMQDALGGFFRAVSIAIVLALVSGINGRLFGRTKHSNRAKLSSFVYIMTYVTLYL